MKKTGRILMLCALLFLTACSRGEAASEEKVSEESNAVAAIAIAKGPEWVYVPEIIEVGDTKADYEDMQLIGDRFCYISLPREDNSTQNFCRYSVREKELTAIPIEWQTEGAFWEISTYVFDQEYKIWLIANVYSEDYSQLRRFLCRFDSDGKYLFSQEITDELGRGISIGGMAVDRQGRIYIYTNEYSDEAGIWLYTEEGNFHGLVTYNTSETVQVKGTVEGDDGKLYVCISKGENPECCTLVEVNFEDSRMTELTEDFPNVNGFCSGKRPDRDSTGATEDSAEQGETAVKQYDFLLYDNTYAYGCNLAAQENGSRPIVEELLAWADSDVNGYYVTNLGISEDGRYYCMVEDWTNDDRCIVFLKKTKWDEAPKRVNLTLAAVNGESGLTSTAVRYNRNSELAAMAVRYNRNNSPYHLTVKYYDSLMDLYNAILTKESIDILDLSGVNVKKLAGQGFFEDLTPYLEQSEKFKPSDFLDGLLAAYTFDGILAGIPEAFTMRTVVGDKTQLGDAPSLSLEGLFAAASRNPEALPFGGPYEEEVTREEVMQYLMMFNEDTFIDWDTGKCSFDSETFKKVLELVSRFPGSDTGGRQNGHESELSLPSRLQNGEVLFAIANMSGLKDFQLYEEIFGEKVSCMGFPTGDGTGGTLLYTENAFGIVAGSENKSAAWKFVESIPDWRIKDGMEKDEIYRLYWFPDRLPSLKRTLNIMVDYRIEEDLEWAARGHQDFGGKTYQDGWRLEYHIMTSDDVNILLNLVKGAAPAFDLKNDEIINIINEEAPGYYSGQKQVEDVVKIIQNRIQLYVDENQGL